MKLRFWPLASCTAIFLTGCHSDKTDSDVVSQQFVHKYGFNISQREWNERAQDGQVITQMSDGVTVTQSFENGQLHGNTVYTFPHSSVIRHLQVYDQGSLLREVFSDVNGIPINENVYEFDDHIITTQWDEKGAPLSIEDYVNDTLVEGKYYTSEHELESSVAEGTGTRIKRDRSGILLVRDQLDHGMLTERVNYHPNGQPQCISHYENYQLHGEQIKNTPSGKPLMVLHWNHGELDGLKTIYRNGIKIAEVPYVNGKREGMEFHYDDFGTLTAEIQWKDDKKHGISLFHSEETTEHEWFYRGQVVSEEKFNILDNREKLIAEINADWGSDQKSR